MKIYQYPTPHEVAIALAREIFIRGTQQGDIHVAISGGSTPKLLFELMASSPLREEINWAHVHLYWVDERCVPPTDEQSNYGMTKEAMLRSVPIPTEQVHRIMGESDPSGEAIRYTELVRRRLPAGRKLPIFDAVILGIGDDGHTSSIFPHQMKLLETPTPYVVATHPSGQKRIAMTGPTIMAAKRVLFHAVGESKRTILRQIINQAPEAQAYPSSYFFERRDDVELYTDQSL